MLVNYKHITEEIAAYVCEVERSLISFSGEKHLPPPKLKEIYLYETLLNNYQARKCHIAENGKFYIFLYILYILFIMRQKVSQIDNNQIKKEEKGFTYGET